MLIDVQKRMVGVVAEEVQATLQKLFPDAADSREARHLLAASLNGGAKTVRTQKSSKRLKPRWSAAARKAAAERARKMWATRSKPKKAKAKKTKRTNGKRAKRAAKVTEVTAQAA